MSITEVPGARFRDLILMVGRKPRIERIGAWFLNIFEAMSGNVGKFGFSY